MQMQPTQKAAPLMRGVHDPAVREQARAEALIEIPLNAQTNESGNE